MKSQMLGLLLGTCALSASATDFALKIAPTSLANWKDGSFYEGGQAPTGVESDRVILAADMQALVDDSSVGFVSSLGRIVPNAGSSLVVDIRNDAALNCLYSACAMPGYATGTLVKKGAGCLSLGRDKRRGRIGGGPDDYDYDAYYKVEAGTVKLPETGVSSAGRAVTKFHYSGFEIDEGATIVLSCEPNGTAVTSDVTFNLVGYLRGAGTLRSESWSTTEDPRVQITGGKPVPDVFSGMLVNNFFFYSNPYLYLTGTESTAKSTIWWIYGNYGWSNWGTVGVKKIGLDGNEGSSIGKSTTIGLLENGARFLYLGEGETTKKTFIIGESQTGGYAEYIDAGATGGVTFQGTWRTAGSNGYVHRLHLDGSNTVPCVIEGPLYGINDSRFYCVKQGTGTWRLADNADRRDVCGWGVENGVLQFDSLAETNEACAFGPSPRFGEDVFAPIGTYDAAPSAYYFRLGTAMTAGKLEFTGSGTAYQSSRPLVLAGDGELKNSAKADASNEPGRFIFLGGVEAKTAGLKTLTLSGDTTGESVVAAVKDGAGQVKVVKDGIGTWTLCGANSAFSGGLDVKKGTLVYRGAAGKFTWFRFRVRGVQGSSTVTAKIAEFCLYDKDNRRINGNLIRNFLNASDETWSPAENVGYSRMCEKNIPVLKPGECAICERREHYNVGAGDVNNIEKIFQSDADCASEAGLSIFQPTYWKDPISESKSHTHVPFAFRLPDDCNEMVKFDLSSQSWGGDEGVKSYLFEGSVDGITWYTICDEHNAPLVKRTKVGAENIPWLYSSSELFTAETVLTHTGGKAAIGSVSGHPVVIGGPVSVAAGATLKVTAEVEIPQLKVDLANGGRIEGATFAEDGIIDLVNFDKDSPEEVPLGFVDCEGVENVCNWGLCINGQPSNRRTISYKDGVLYARRRGMAIIVR